MIDIKVETEKVIKKFVDTLRENGKADVADRIAANDYTSEVAEKELIPKLKDLEDEVTERNTILEKLQIKKDIAMSTNNYGDLAKIAKIMMEVEAGDLTNTLVKKYKQEIIQKKKQDAKKKTMLVSEMSIQDIIDKYNFYMSSAKKLVWFFQSTDEDEFGNRKWNPIFKDTLLANFSVLNVFIRGQGGEPDFHSLTEFNKKLVDQGRTFYEITQSYTKKTSKGLINIIPTNFCPPNPTGDTKYHWMFDAMFESISGSTKDDMHPKDIFEKTCIVKYLRPEDPFIPCLVITDFGSSGKGLFGGTFCSTLYGHNVADNCATHHVTGHFNGLIAGKAAVIVNEATRDKVDIQSLKRILGSPTLPIENKFEVPYTADNTALYVMFSNPEGVLGGGVTLSGGPSDRRYNLFSTKRTIYEIVADYREKVDGVPYSISDATDWIEDVGQYYLKDILEVGKWINAMVSKHSKVKHVRADFGTVYQAALANQRPGWVKTVEDVFEDPNFVYIREQLLRDLIKEFNKSERYIAGRNNMQYEIEDLIRIKNYDIELAPRCRIVGKQQTIQRTVWKKKLVPHVKEDESMYGEIDSNGRWVWKWVA